jgi:predicted Ser/Thr protein kinase
MTDASAISSSRPREPFAPGDRFREHEVLGRVGRGAAGFVYRARHLRLGREVALKILAPQLAVSRDPVTRFHREAKALASLNHPNVIQVHDFGEEGGLFFLVLEYVDGRDLQDHLDESVRLDPGRMLRVMADVASGLSAIHAAGLVHGGLKPADILVDRRGRAKIADFGLAVESGLGPGAPSAAIGATYISPEQAAGLPPDRRSDLYAFGSILFHGLTGRPPFSAATRAEMLAQHLRQPPPLELLRGCASARLSGLVEGLLRKDPAARPADAAAIRPLLEEEAARPASRSLQGSERGSSRRWILAAAGAAGVVAVGSFLAFPPRPVRPPADPRSGPLELLALVDPVRDGVSGVWTLRDGKLECDGSVKNSRLMIPFAPGEEYDLDLSVERIDGNESFHLGLVCGNGQVAVILDGWPPQGGISGLHIADRQGADANGTGIRGRIFTNGVPSRIECSVRRGRIHVVVDGRDVVRWEGGFDRLMLAPGSEVPSRDALFLGVWESPFRFHRMRLRPVTGSGSVLRGSRP